ncbi:uncharacterized protein [Dermacentor albipictus]|uniref:uncharacterized protein isoform X2 n=1 Tax=Dermacentor albipictus TaxID=60249 RepID=UPI0038FCD527
MATDRDEVETILSSILASEKDGLTLRRLDDEYRATVGTCVPFEDFGHDTLAEFLESMPEVVSLQRGFNKDIVAHAAYNAATAHVTKMVAEQKSGPVRVRKQHVQRPCHWKVHPYRKRPWSSKNSTARDSYKFASRSSGLTSGPAYPETAGHFHTPVEFSTPTRKPLMELPANVEQLGSSQYSNRRGASQKRRDMKFPTTESFMYGNGWYTANAMAWTSFLKAAGIVRQRATMYARLLMLHGVNPSSMWLLTGQDIFQMGIGDFRDIHLIQEHAHQLHAMHRSSVIADNWLGGAGYPGAFSEGSAEQDGVRTLVHVPVRHNRRWARAKGHHDRSATLENECWLEDDRLHLTPPLRRTRILKLKHGFVPTPLNLRSVVGGSSIKWRLGWRN